MSYELLPQPPEDTKEYTHDKYREDHELYINGPEGWTHVGLGIETRLPCYIKHFPDGYDEYFENGSWVKHWPMDGCGCNNIRSRQDIGHLLRTHFDGYNNLWDAIHDRDDW